MSAIIEKYRKQIDYTGSEKDRYASLVFSCLMQIGKPFEMLLEEAEKQGKKIKLIDELVDEITIDNVMIES